MSAEQLDGPWLDEMTVEQFPAQFRDLVDAIGARAVVKLASRFGGTQFYIPKADGLVGSQRDQMIRADRKKGDDYRDIAKKFGLTEVWVRRICDHAEKDNKQMSLF